MLQALNIPIIALPSQQFKVRLFNQDCSIKLFLRGLTFYMDLLLKDEPVRVGAIVEVNRPILIDIPSTQFVGQLYLTDTRQRGEPQEPRIEGLGSRWKLAYVYDDGLEVL